MVWFGSVGHSPASQFGEEELRDEPVAGLEVEKA